MPQGKGQVEEIAVRAVKTKIMSWITSLLSVMMWTEFLVAFCISKEESLTSMKKKNGKKSIAWNWSERKGYREQEPH